jgi:long-subunit acyl-CoA synthetase (AMP-forming)
MEVAERAESFSIGLVELDLVPERIADGKKWRFLGIKSRNRAEWYTAHLGNMHQNVTTVSLFDQLDPQATKFIVAETKMRTMCVESNQI